MADTVRVEVITPDKVVVEADAKMVVAPGECGQFGVLPGHTTFLTLIKAGTLRYLESGGAERTVFVGGGFVEVSQNRVSVLTEVAEQKEDIDVERARAARKRAQDRLAGNVRQEKIDFERAEAALKRAIMRIRISESSSGA